MDPPNNDIEEVLKRKALVLLQDLRQFLVTKLDTVWVHRLRDSVRIDEQEVSLRERNGFFFKCEFGKESQRRSPRFQCPKSTVRRNKEWMFMSAVAAMQGVGPYIEDRIEDRCELFWTRAFIQEAIGSRETFCR